MDWDILQNRLEKKGLIGPEISPYLRDVFNSLDSGEEINLDDLNNRLKRLGWADVDLDDHTLQMIIASAEKNTLKKHHLESRLGFNTND
jgi:hypothetical protein